MKFIPLYIGIAILMLNPLSARAFSLAPGLIEVSVSPGDSAEFAISLINTEDSPITVYLSRQKFLPNESTGAPRFIPYEDDRSDILEWLSLPADRLQVPGKTKIDLPIQINVPPQVRSGGYYAAVMFSPAPYDVVADNGVSIQAKTAVLVLLTVLGENTAKLALLDFTSPETGAWLALPSGQFAYRLQNQGNIHSQPAGSVVLKDIFGRVISVANANPASSRVLPASTRTFEVDFGPPVPQGFFSLVMAEWRNFALGPVTASLHLEYDSMEQALESEFSFIVFPWHFLLLLAVCIVIACFAGLGLRSRIARK